MITTILAFLIALGILITFHELGHYWAARRCGVKVLRFSVGFGKPLFKRMDRHGTEWVVAGIPLGGYVKMQQEAPADASPEQRAQAFETQPVRNRFFIVAAGPMANFILAAVLYACLSWVGTQEPAPILAQPPESTIAHQVGVQSGDRVTSVNGQPVVSWGQVRWHLLQQSVAGGEVTLILDRYGRQIEKTMTFSGIGAQPEADGLAKAGVLLAGGQPRIGQVQPSGSGQRAGLMSGDVVLAVGSVSEPDVRTFIETIRDHPEQSLTMSVMRNGAPLTISVTPEAHRLDDATVIGRIGVAVNSDIPMVTIEHGVFGGLWEGVARTFNTAWFSLKMLGKMITGDVSWKNISGPVTIADYAGQTAKMGLTAYIAFLALVSVSIGVLNLLPIPMLDGGHLMFYLIEMVRGKPAPERWLDVGHRAGVVVLAGLMTLAIFNDLTRLLS
jgi:regulator of sigma E protease